MANPVPRKSLRETDVAERESRAAKQSRAMGERLGIRAEPFPLSNADCHHKPRHSARRTRQPASAMPLVSVRSFQSESSCFDNGKSADNAEIPSLADGRNPITSPGVFD